MAGNRTQQTSSEGFEDQFRRLIVHNPSLSASPSSGTGQPFHPVVSLPPPGPPVGSLNQSPLPTQQLRPHGRNQNSNLPNDPSIVLPHSQGGTGHRSPAIARGGHRNLNQQQHSQGIPTPSHQYNGHRDPFMGQQGPRQPQNQQRARFQQQVQVDPNAFQRTGYGQQPQQRGFSGPQQLFNPNAPQQRSPMPDIGPNDQNSRQAQYLEQMAAAQISDIEMTVAEREEKEAYLSALQQICNEVCASGSTQLPTVSLECFGSFKSGFATAGSDMDLVIVVKDQSPTSACFSLLEDDLPRVLEQRLLQLGHGARLLTRTRVPIIKVCEKPDAEFLEKLREERKKWDDLAPEKKYPHLFPVEDVPDGEDASEVIGGDGTNPEATRATHEAEALESQTPSSALQTVTSQPSSNASLDGTPGVGPQVTPEAQENIPRNVRPPPRDKTWTRERKAGPLDFPKTGVGIQSDINFFNPLGLHNTQLLRCYSLCDSRVRPMILFVKAWAKRRKINSSYSGTLSSYGYVLMVLHYLVNVAQPAVLPNLQSSWRPPGTLPASETPSFLVEGWNIWFWHNDEDIYNAAQRGLLTSNRESLGSLLAGFFHYYSSQGGGLTFRWMQEVLSLRSIGGLMTKEEKGWVKAVTEEGEGKKIQHRFLFCIEDPFELSHNVARTVTHNGIVAIRDEFRRAKRILHAIGFGQQPRDGALFAPLLEAEGSGTSTERPRAHGSTNVARIQPHAKAHSAAPAIQSDGSPQQFSSNPQARNVARIGGLGRGRPNQQASLPMNRNPKAFDVNDSESFPTLGKPGKAPKKKRHSSVDKVPIGEYGEISGDKAKLVLEEVRRKKDEAQAESTAMGAAAAVLGDSD